MNENALALARQHAPCYIYSREILTAQAETLHRTFPGFDILFSVKANPFCLLYTSPSPRDRG